MFARTRAGTSLEARKHTDMEVGSPDAWPEGWTRWVGWVGGGAVGASGGGGVLAAAMFFLFTQTPISPVV